MNKDVLEKKASDFRQQLGIGSHAAMHIKSVLNKLNVITIFKPLGDNLSGMAVKLIEGNNALRFILVNSNKSIGKQHFTICHELYHLYIQENFRSQTCITGIFNRDDKEEFNADWFAAFLLLPESGIKSLIPDNEIGKNKLKLNTILKIEHYFGASRAALLVRLQELKLINKEYAENFKFEVKKNALINGYLISLYEEGNHNEFIGDYGSIATGLFMDGKLSENQYHQLLNDLIGSYSDLKKLLDTNENSIDENNS